MRWIEEEAQAKKAAAAKRAAAAEKSARKLAAEKSRPDLQMQFFRKHAKTLYYKRRALFAPDEYGKRKPSEWNQEVERFLTVVTPARFRPKGREEKLRAKKQLLKIVNEFASTLEDEGVALKDPLEFERYCADLLSKAGWKAGTTKRTGDQGVDVIAEKGGKTLILQCKLYSQPVGNKAVQEALSGMRFVGADLAIVVSNAGFTRSAQQLAHSLGVLLIHYSELSALPSRLLLRG